MKTPRKAIPMVRKNKKEIMAMFDPNVQIVWEGEGSEWYTHSYDPYWASINEHEYGGCTISIHSARPNDTGQDMDIIMSINTLSSVAESKAIAEAMLRYVSKMN